MDTIIILYNGSLVVFKTAGSLRDLPLLTYTLLRKMTIVPRKLNNKIELCKGGFNRPLDLPRKALTAPILQALLYVEP